MPNNPYETSSNPPELPFAEISIDETELSLLGDMQAYLRIRQEALQLGYKPEQLLYRGIDRWDIDANGKFRHDRDSETGSDAAAVWAFTDEEFAAGARRADNIGQRSTDSVLFYAYDASDPAVVILDANKLVSLERQKGPDATGQDKFQYVPAENGSLEDAIIAVVNITH